MLVVILENKLIKSPEPVSSKMANAICFLHPVRNQIPLKVRVKVFKSVVLSHLSFSGVFLQKT